MKTGNSFFFQRTRHKYYFQLVRWNEISEKCFCYASVGLWWMVCFVALPLLTCFFTLPPIDFKFSFSWLSNSLYVLVTSFLLSLQWSSGCCSEPGMATISVWQVDTETKCALRLPIFSSPFQVPSSFLTSKEVTPVSLWVCSFLQSSEFFKSSSMQTQECYETLQILSVN